MRQIAYSNISHLTSKPMRFEAVPEQHFWQVVDNKEHIWVAKLDARYGNAELTAKAIALLLNFRKGKSARNRQVANERAPKQS